MYILQVMDTWLAYAPVKNNPEDASKVSHKDIFMMQTASTLIEY